MSLITHLAFRRGVGLTLILSAVVTAVQVVAAEPEVLRRWDFDKPGDLEGWHTPHGIREVAVTDGRLRLVTSNPDAYIFAPPVDVPLDGLVVRVGLRGEKGGTSEVYWVTRGQPAWGEQHCSRQSVAEPQTGTQPDGWATLEFPLGKPADAGRVVTAFRIDPLNGPASNAVEIDFVELVRRPPVMETRFSFRSHQVAVGQAVEATASVRQVDGRAVTEEFRIEVPAGEAAGPTTRPTSPGAVVASSGMIRYEQPGVQACRARISAGREVIADCETSIIVGQGESLPTLPGLRSDRVRLDLIAAPDGKSVGGARWMAANRLVGWLLPLVEVTVLKDGAAVTRTPVMSVLASSPEAVLLEGRMADLRDWQLTMALELQPNSGRAVVRLGAELRGPQGGQLLDFSVPVVRVDRDPPGDPTDRFAIFGGLEFLEPGWSSSSDRAVGDKFAERWSPHPFKVTLPMMAVEAGRMTSALLWKPRVSGSDVLPVATFASPNFHDGQPNHLMKLSVPMREENESLARRPYTLTNNRSLLVQAMLVAEPDVPVALACRWWYDLFGTPPPQPRPHDDREMYDLIARSFGETMYWPQEKGWRHHWYMDKSSHYAPEMAATLIGHAIETGQKKWVEGTGQTGRQIVDAAGPLSVRITQEGPARSAMSSMKPDGTWPFTNTEAIRRQAREMTNGKYDSLGQDGSTSVGTCVQQALPILKYARLAGSQRHVEAGLKALEAMRQFRVPRGAQVWEVHQEIPDIRAAALATEAYRLAYEITGDPQWLDDASYWAWCGVPFVYSWNVPIEDRGGFLLASRDKDDWKHRMIPLKEAYGSGRPRVTPYGTVPVLGPTFYVVNWFGVLVQWCGLEWAQHVIELDADRPDPLLRYIADGVVLSGLQQMMDKEPWIGLYPDSWHTQTNIAYPALIYPGLLMRCLQAQGRLPDWSEPWTRVVNDESGRRWHVSSWGRPVEVQRPVIGGPWVVKVAFPRGQQNELLVANVDKPMTVRVGSDVLDSLTPDAAPGSLGWRYDAQRRALIARFTQPVSISEIRVTW